MATIVFKKGFKHKGFYFGWHKNTLFRLPTKIHKKEYGIRKIPIIRITKRINGYRVIRDKKSFSQVNSMIVKIKPIKVTLNP